MRAQAPDYKESMEVGRELDPGGVAPKWKNEWPPAGVVSLASRFSRQQKEAHTRRLFVPSFPIQLDTYKPQIMKFFDLNHKLQLEVMRSIALGLKLDESYFDDKVSVSRLLPSSFPFLLADDLLWWSSSYLTIVRREVPQPPTSCLPFDTCEAHRRRRNSSWCPFW